MPPRRLDEVAWLETAWQILAGWCFGLLLMAIGEALWTLDDTRPEID